MKKKIVDYILNRELNEFEKEIVDYLLEKPDYFLEKLNDLLIE